MTLTATNSGLFNVPAPEELSFFNGANVEKYRDMSASERYEVVLRTQCRLDGFSPVGVSVSVNEMSLGTLSGHMEAVIEKM